MFCLRAAEPAPESGDGAAQESQRQGDFIDPADLAPGKSTPLPEQTAAIGSKAESAQQGSESGSFVDPKEAAPAKNTPPAKNIRPTETSRPVILPVPPAAQPAKNIPPTESSRVAIPSVPAATPPAKNIPAAETAKNAPPTVPPAASGGEGEFADPGVAAEEPFVSRNSAPAAAVTGEAAEVVNTRVLGKLARNAVISTVEHPMNVSYEGEGEIIEVAGEAGAEGKTPPPAIDEKGASELVKGVFGAEAAGGALAYFKKKNLMENSFAQAVKQALERNLTIRFSEKGYEQTDAAITQAQAIKDPVFNVSLQSQQIDTYDRREYIVRRRYIEGGLQSAIQGAFQQPTTQPSTAFVNPNDPEQITVVPSSTVGNVDAFNDRGDFDYASARSLTRSETLNTTYLHQLPWGSYFTGTLSTIHYKPVMSAGPSGDSLQVNNPTDPNGPIYTDANGNLRHSPLVVSPALLGVPPNSAATVFYDAYSRSSGGVFRAWSADLSLQLTVPVPYTKDWGPNGPTEVPTKLAQVAQDRAYWQLQSAINSTVQNVNNGYWNVVRALRSLEVISANRKSLEQMAKQTDDLLKLNRVTAYEISQTKTQVKAAQGAEEGAWAQYVAASNALNNLLNYDKDTVVLPVNYAGDLTGGISFQAADVLPLAMSNNPDLRIAKADLDAAAVNLKFAHNQVRPDLKLSAGVDWTENGTPPAYGYKNFYTAISNIEHPDTGVGFVTLNYRVPWGNRPAEDTLAKTEQAYRQSGKIMSDRTNKISQQVNDAVAAVLSRRQQAALAWKNVQTAEQVLKGVKDLWEQGRVPDTGAVKNTPTFTLLAKNTDLLNARLQYIQTQIALKQAEGQLLAAQGLIAARYAADLKITVKPVVEPEKREAAKTEAEKKEEAKKEAEKKAGEKKQEPAKEPAK